MWAVDSWGHGRDWHVVEIKIHVDVEIVVIEGILQEVSIVGLMVFIDLIVGVLGLVESREVVLSVFDSGFIGLYFFCRV